MPDVNFNRKSASELTAKDACSASPASRGSRPFALGSLWLYYTRFFSLFVACRATIFTASKKRAPAKRGAEWVAYHRGHFRVICRGMPPGSGCPGSMTNWCLKMRTQNTLSLRASAHTGVAIPRLDGKCIDNCPTERELLRFLVVIATWFHSSGGLPRPVCALVSQ